MAENNLGLQAIAGSVLWTGKDETYSSYRCTLVQADGAQELQINGIDIHLVAGVQVSININPRELTVDPSVKTTFWCSCLDGCNVNAFTGTTIPGAGALADPYSGMSAMNRPTIIGGGGLNN